MRPIDQIVDALVEQGVTAIFGVPGGQTLALYECLERAGNQSIRHIDLMDERSAAYAADSYGRVTGKIGVCDGTVGPGATNLISGLAEAMNSSTPLLALVSELKSDTMHLAEWGAASQGIDQLQLLRPVAKWLGVLRSGNETDFMIRRALAAATTGRPGPAVLIVPQDVLESTSDRAATASPVHDSVGPFARPTRTQADTDAVNEAVELLDSAAAPLFVLGGGVLLSGAMEEARALAEALGAPVVTTWSGKGAIAETHPLALGVLGVTGSAASRRAAEKADVVLVAGYKSAQNSTFGWTFPAETQKVIHIDIDPTEPGKVFKNTLALVGDARAVFAQMSQRYAATHQPRASSRWLSEVHAWSEANRQGLAAPLRFDAKPIRPQRVVSEISRVARQDDLLVCDASFASGWGALYYTTKKAGRTCVFPRGMAGLGFGLPAAIGAAVATPESKVFLVAGDGGFAYSVQELAVAAKLNLSIVVAVLNNSAYGWIRHSAKARYGRDLATSSLPRIDYAMVAQGLGCRGRAVENPNDIGPVLAEAMEMRGPVVIDIRTNDTDVPMLTDPRGVIDPYSH